MINYIRETILFGLEDDFIKDGVLHLSLGEDAGKQFKITIEEENNK